jgi:acyl-CoA dehydrogenase
MARFLQKPPELADAWSSDRVLLEALLFNLGDELYARAEHELAAMGQVATAPETRALAMQAEQEPPQHIPYSPWGERIDEITVSPAYLELGRIGVEAGITALPYEDSAFADKARIVWAGLHCLWGPSSALYSCPVAMTDAAARTLLEHGDVDDVEIVGRLTSRDFDNAWTSGQWMTETAGGSDVGRTATVATQDADGQWRLFGTKWFTSATTADMALTLARPEGAPEGARGLALFRIHRYLEDGTRNQILVRRLKDKLGTRALPTAELELEGALARPVGDPHDGGGVRRIATMLNITRIHNALGAAGGMGRGLALARGYARVREVFGKPLHTLPAHKATLSDLAVDYAAALVLALRCCELTGRMEHGIATDRELTLLRGLTPMTKLATARWAVASAAEAMEAIGGVGYCEDSGIPALVRNAHVLPIWEGTTNVLSLDLLRAAQKSDSVSALLDDARSAVQGLSEDPAVSVPAARAGKAIDELESRAGTMAEDLDRAQASARSFALGLATTYACASLCAQGAWAASRGDRRTAAAAGRLAARGLLAAGPPDDLELAMDDEIVSEALRPQA